MIRKSLITKITLSTTLLLFVAIGISWLIHIRIYEVQLMEELHDKIETVLDTAESSISKSMRIGKTGDTQKILELVNSHLREASTVRIFHPDGVIIKSTNLLEPGKKTKDFVLDALYAGREQVIYTDDRGQRIMSHTKPVRNRRSCYQCHGEGRHNIGILEVEVSLDLTEAKLAEAKKRSNISALLISLLLSTFILLLLYWIIIKPLSSLSHKMSLAEKGDLTVKSGLTQGDEIGNLGRSFDSMIERLQLTRTELEKYHFQQMERVDRLASVGELASGIAHEIKNPLAGIAGAVQVLARGFKGDESRERVVKEILQQIDRLDRSVKDLLNYASPSMPRFEAGDLNEVVEKALYFVTRQPKAQEIKVIKELDPGMPKGLFDAKQIQQVLLNLFLNAVNAMDGKGILEIKTYRKGEDAIVEVRDTGPGIPEEIIPNLFLPFYTTRAEGTGLGLSISKRIVEQHGGDLRVESEVGAGACFYVVLPIEGPKEEGEKHEKG
jgi:signal transduction histidine kinase